MIRQIVILFLTLLSFNSFGNALPTLTVYTYNSFLNNRDAINAIKTAFSQRCHCELEFQSASNGVELLNRLKLENTHSKADVIIGLDNNLLADAEKTGLFAPHELQPKLAIEWHNPTFIPFNYSYFAFIYNKKNITQPPHSFNELLTSNYSIIYSDPRLSTPGLGLLLWIEKLYDEKSADIWQKLAAKTVTVTSGWSEAYGLFLKGEADFVLSYVTSPVYNRLYEHDDNYVPAIFDEGHYPQIEIAGILASSKQKALAKEFLSFLLTPDIQALIATANIMYPVVNTALPDAFNTLPNVDKTLQFDAEIIRKNKRKWLNTWRNALSH